MLHSMKRVVLTPLLVLLVLLDRPVLPVLADPLAIPDQLVHKVFKVLLEIQEHLLT
jgi:hypothetical protein